MKSQQGLSTKHQSEYFSYCRMIARCYNIKDNSYKRYGGRGIIVCDRWLDSFVNFMKDMGTKPSSGFSIERKNINKNYEPNNCIWISMKEQSLNKCNSVKLTFNGKTMNVSLWAKKIGINRQTLHERIKRGYSIKNVLTKSVNDNKHINKRVYKQSKTKSNEQK